VAIISDGTQSFGIQDSPLSINSITYVCEAFNTNYNSNRVDIDDSNGEPLGATLVPQRIEGTATLQYSTDSAVTAPIPSIGQEFTTSATNGRNNDTWMITSASDAQSQGDYGKCTINFYNSTN